MRKAYRILADLIAIGVAVQAMAITWAMLGLVHWVDKGGTLDHRTLKGWEDKAPDFQGAAGFAIHGILGTMVLPVLALVLLVVAFFAGVNGAVKWAAVVVVSVLIQVGAGMGGEDAPWLGLIHGLNAFALFSVAIVAARAAHPEAQTAATATP
jgi:hypothetical protein